MPPTKPVHAIEYLQSPEAHPPRPVCVAFGDEAFLKRQVLVRLRQAVLGGGEGEYSLSTFDGATAGLADVLKDLATMAMFGQGKRLVVVEEADNLVTRCRGELEDYVARPRATGVLVLEVASWPANTRLYKAVAAAGFLQVECAAPKDAKGRDDPRLLAKWLTAWARQAHGASLDAAAAELLLEMVGPELGLLDQELAKLAVSVPKGQKVTPDMVVQMVGWRAKTVWDMLDAALEGNVGEALSQLDRLLLSGENPIAILGQVSASLRRLAAATRLFLDAKAAHRRMTPRDALQQAGLTNPYILGKVEKQLLRLGRRRGDQLYDWLLEADLDLKGDSVAPPDGHRAAVHPAGEVTG